MFLGRKTTGEQVAQELETKGKGLLAHPEDQVYAAIRSLESHDYLHMKEKIGREKLRTANLDPAIAAFEHFDRPFNVELIEAVGRYMQDFPFYISQILGAQQARIKGKEWSYFMDRLYGRFVEVFIVHAIAEAAAKKGRQKDFVTVFVESYLTGFHATANARTKVKDFFEFQDSLFEKVEPKDKKVFKAYAAMILKKKGSEMFSRLVASKALKPREVQNFERDLDALFSDLRT
jgi:hypothetical protein